MSEKRERLEENRKKLKPEYRGLSTVEIIEKALNKSGTKPVNIQRKKGR